MGVMPLSDSEFYSALDIEQYHQDQEINGKVTTIIEDHFGLFASIDQYVSDIVSSKALALERHIKRGRVVFKGLMLSKYSGLLRSFIDQVQLDQLPHELARSESYQLFAAACQELAMPNERYEYPEKGAIGFLRRRGELENEFIERIRRKAASTFYRASVARRIEQARKNYESGAKFVDRAFERYSKLLIVRVDLGYKLDGLDELTISRAQDEFNQLWPLCHSKKYKQTFGSMVGYIRKLEFTRRKRYHYHLILLFDGQKVKSGYYYADRIGKIWEDDITGGRGISENCHVGRRRYPQCYLGMIDRTDLQKRGYLLEHGVKYLAKKEQYLEVKTEGVRTFQTSQIKPRQSAVGRPRTVRTEQGVSGIEGPTGLAAP